jgi:hypothetical protein
MEAKTNIEATEAEVKGGQVVEALKPANEKTADEKVKVKRGRMDSVSIYEMSEGELTVLENGSKNSIYLNFSIFLLSTAISFFTALVTADYKGKDVVFTIFVVLTVAGFLGGAFLLLLWLRMSDEFKGTIDKIKKRIKE